MFDDQDATPHTAADGQQRRRRLGRAVRTSSVIVATRVVATFGSRGAGFSRLASSHAGSVAGDTLVTLALAGTLFFSVPSTEARQNMAVYLLITLAPFAVLGPFLGWVYERFPGAYRSGMVLSSSLRAAIALTMGLALESVVLFPLAFTLLVLSRFHGISRSSVLPVVLARREELVSGNAHIARLGVLGGAVVAPLGLLAGWLDAPWLGLILAAIVYSWSALAAGRLPIIDIARSPRHGRERVAIPRPARLARFATAAVRFLNGYLMLLVAFAFRDADAGAVDFGFLIAAGGLGYLVAALLTPLLERRLAEEPMVMTGLALEAGAAFVAAQAFGLPAAAALAAAAGLAWGTAKFGFDGLLQSAVPIDARGRAFTNSETMFQIAWVIGALLPIVPAIPVELGLSLAGIAALAIQVIYVAALMPTAVERRDAELARSADGPETDGGVLDVM